MSGFTLGRVTPRRTLAFSVVTGVVLAGATSALFPTVSSAWQPSAAAGLVAGLLWIGGGLVAPRFRVFVYKAWNYVAKRVERFLTVATSAICFHCVIRLAGLAGSSLPLEKKGGARSSWVQRRQTDTAPNANRYYGHHGALSRWENRWAVCLAPFVLLLNICSPETEAEAPTEIYTLF